MTAAQLAARRQLLAASATLQRLRLAHEVDAMRSGLMLRPPRWAGLALAGAALAAWWVRSSRERDDSSPQTVASVWALRGLTLWRAASALRRVWLARRPRG